VGRVAGLAEEEQKKKEILTQRRKVHREERNCGKEDLRG
jgi:hypothetical protein